MRLDTIASDIVELIRKATVDARRRTAVLAAEFAVRSSGLDEQQALAALDAVREGRFGQTPERRVLEGLIEALDERQWNLQDAVEANEATVDQQLRAFGQARAASAILCAGGSDPLVAAADAIYEASVVVDDLDELRSLVITSLSN